MTAGPLHATLVANVVTTLSLDLPDPPQEYLSAVPRHPRVEVLNLDGAAIVYFTTSGTAPTVGGTGSHVLPAAVCSVEVDDETAGTGSTVKLISSGTPVVSVRAL